MKIIILDKNLVQQTIISSWIGATFNQRINSQGSFKIRINANSKQAGQVELGQIVYLESDICGYINRIEYDSEKDKASEVMTISGIELKDTMRSRITYPPNGEAAYSYTDTKADVIAVDLLNKLLINPVDTRKKVSIFRLGGTTDVGTKIDFSTRLKPLDKQIYELLSTDKIGLKCSVNLDDKLAYFSLFEGVDRTVNQSVNPRAVFSLTMGTLEDCSTLKDSTSYKNIGYIGGDGEGIDRTIIELPDSNILSGLDRWEVFIDTRDAETQDELTSRGSIGLAEFDHVYSVEGCINYNDKLIYEIGDFVTIKDKTGDYENVQITGRSRIFSGTNVSLRQYRQRKDHLQSQSQRFCLLPPTQWFHLLAHNKHILLLILSLVKRRLHLIGPIVDGMIVEYLGFTEQQIM